MKRLFILSNLLCWFFICSAQNDTVDYSVKIKERAAAMGQLLLKKDFDAFSAYTYPKILEMMGGRQKMVQTLKKGADDMAGEGAGFTNFTFGKPSPIIHTGDELQCTLPQTIEMKVPKGRLVTESTLIAISSDNGKTWYFMDTSGKNIDELRKILPNLSPQLVIPKRGQPVLYPSK